MVVLTEGCDYLNLRSNAFDNKPRDYDVYHDESLEHGFWHGILFVPRDSRKRLLTLLANIRQSTDRFHPLSLKNLNKTTGKLYKCTSCWLQVGVAALIQDFKGRAYATPTGADGQWAQYLPFDQLVRARFVLFRVKGGLGPLNLCHDYAAKVETTFRMAFKGGLTMFSREDEELCIRSLYFDGHKHYHRRLDLRRVLRDIGTPPTRVHLHDEIELSDDSSDHREAGAQPYDDCQLLQLTDILVSGFRTILAEAPAPEAHREVSRPLSELVDKWNRGRKGFSYSRWFKGFCVSEGYIEDGQWQFGAIEPDYEILQTELFDNG